MDAIHEPRRPCMNRIGWIAALGTLLASCAYNGELDGRAAAFKPPAYFEPIELSVELDDSGNEVDDFSLHASFVTNTISLKAGVVEAFSETLGNVIPDMTLSSRTRKRPDLLLVPVLVHQPLRRDFYNANFDYQMITGLRVKDGRTRRSLAVFQDSKVVSYSPPGSVNLLGVVTGLTLFLSAPITLPVAAQIGGNHATDLVQQAFSASVREVTLDFLGSKDKILGKLERSREEKGRP